MSYPTLGIEAARAAHKARVEGASPPGDAEATLYKSGADFDPSKGIDCLNQCCDLALQARDAHLVGGGIRRSVCPARASHASSARAP